MKMALEHTKVYMSALLFVNEPALFPQAHYRVMAMNYVMELSEILLLLSRSK